MAAHVRRACAGPPRAALVLALMVAGGIPTGRGPCSAAVPPQRTRCHKLGLAGTHSHPVYFAATRVRYSAVPSRLDMFVAAVLRQVDGCQWSAPHLPLLRLRGGCDSGRPRPVCGAGSSATSTASRLRASRERRTLDEQDEGQDESTDETMAASEEGTEQDEYASREENEGDEELDHHYPADSSEEGPDGEDTGGGEGEGMTIHALRGLQEAADAQMEEMEDYDDDDSERVDEDGAWGDIVHACELFQCVAHWPLSLCVSTQHLFVCVNMCASVFV